MGTKIKYMEYIQVKKIIDFPHTLQHVSATD